MDVTNEIHFEVGIPVPDDVGNSAEFRLPGLIRLEPEADNGLAIGEKSPNSVHQFTLPIQPVILPETERKYVLSQKSFARLQRALEADARQWRQVRQHNIYFTDVKEVLFGEKRMLRVRSELEVEPRDKAKARLDSRRQRYYLTLKGEAGLSSRTGEEIRTELEFDVTRVVGRILREKDMPFDALEFDDFPLRYRKGVYNRWTDFLIGTYGIQGEVAYQQFASMVNDRSVFEMWNGFVLELDRSCFNDTHSGREVIEYQLEVELGQDRRSSRELDEYIHDKLARLGIPVVQVDLSQMDGPPYPKKVVQAYAFACRFGDRREEILKPMREVQSRLESPHGADCKRCRDDLD